MTCAYTPLIKMLIFCSGTNNLIVSVERIKRMKKLGLSNPRHLRRVKITRYNKQHLQIIDKIRYYGTESILPLYFQALMRVRDLRSFEFKDFSWKEFYQCEPLKPFWDTFMGRWKRLHLLKADFLVPKHLSS